MDHCARDRSFHEPGTVRDWAAERFGGQQRLLEFLLQTGGEGVNRLQVENLCAGGIEVAL